MTVPDMPAMFLDRQVTVEWRDGESVSGRILTYRTGLYVVLEGDGGQTHCIPWTSINEIWIATEKHEKEG